jgi:glycosyltransferase involved in cell wall biosynthesis
MTPAFSVIISTWNRGAYLLPTLTSALQQDLADEFEILVVGDGCSDDTEAVVAPFLSDRVRWLNLPTRGGSQSFPNNAGLAAARGRHIAYLGHDDIWAPITCGRSTSASRPIRRSISSRAAASATCRRGSTSAP